MLRRGGTTALAVALLAALLPAPAAADETVETTDGRRLLLRSDGIYEFLSRLDPAIVEQALATAKEWAQDQTLIAYCFRTAPERETLARAFAQDRADALARLQRAGATEQQRRQVATIIAENFRPTAGGDTKAMAAACTAKDVEKSVFVLGGSAARCSCVRPSTN
ncbi:MAG TPA: hypothetical protein VGQ90_02475 [Stellaceae bacterium]|nr:hypothetical protein [Stellaceae bacterium]